ncbi:MAG TPA: hypothetical protein VFJ58_19640 [Armatimonadota bacterium]|nr:hypothetical protein [Armatimonadota bacterium]
MRWIPSSAALICAAALMAAGCGGSNQPATTTTPTAPINYGAKMAKTPPSTAKTGGAMSATAGMKTANLSITGMT